MSYYYAYSLASGVYVVGKVSKMKRLDLLKVWMLRGGARDWEERLLRRKVHVIMSENDRDQRKNWDQGNPGRNVVSDKKCAGAEGEELVLGEE